MKSLVILFVSMFLSFSAFAMPAPEAGRWTLVASDSIWSSYPTMRIYPINSNQSFSNILVRVTLGTARIQNLILETKNNGELPLWALQGDYRSPRQTSMVIPATQVKKLRLNMMSLDRNVPARFQILMR